MTANKIESSNILEGTISFWVKPKQIDYANNTVVPLINLNPKSGSIFIVKDSDNKIKAFHVYLGKGRTDLEYDVSTLDSSKEHMFVLTWSVSLKELNLYVDAKKVVSKKLVYK